MRPSKDPFIFGRELTDGELVDREEELDEVVRALQNQRRHFLIGPRRFGKTSILATAARRVRELGGIVVSVNAEQFITEAAVAAEIVAQATRQSGLSLKKALRQTQVLFSSLRPAMSYDPAKDTWTAKLDFEYPDSRTRLVMEAFEGLDRLGASTERPVALIVDEFQKLVADEGVPAEHQLRAVVQRHRHVAYVFAGSDESMMIAMTSDHARPFYRLGSRRFLGTIPREDFRPHLRQVFRRAGAQLTPEAVELILDIGQDVPYNVQRLGLICWEVVQRMRRAKTSAEIEIDEDFVRREFERFLQIESPNYAQITNALTTIQLQTLRFFSEQGRKPFKWQSAAKDLGMATSTFKRAVSALVKKTYVRRVYEDDLAVRFVFEDPFLAAWVRTRLKG